ncbi:MAG: alpha-L-fucosidase [Clostridia bacterium]|nr:alpha-L-fucosidase [Clostridia bacterium]
MEEKRMENEQWYSRNYRRHLCDMHIEDWDDSFLSRFSPEEYVENLKHAKITNAMIYLQSHVGLCYYPTKTGVMHKALVGNEDVIRRLIQLCHKEGIAVTGYYSLNYNTREHDRHPEWRMLTDKGISQRECVYANSEEALAFASTKAWRYGLCCPNNREYNEFTYRQIDEILDYFELEGLFFDMPFWPHTCYCHSCRARWAAEVGGEMPIHPTVGGAEHRAILRKKHQWMGEWIGRVTDYVRSRAPGLSIEHNFASGIAGDANLGCGEEVAAACDFLGGDLYGGIINHSLACKFYKNITPNAPFDYMFSRCKPALRSHTLTKTEDEMRTEIMLTAAHHGATMVIDAIDPVGTMDSRVYQRIGKIFTEQERYEPYFDGVMAEDVGLYYSIKSRFGHHGESYENKRSAISLCTTLIGEHIPFGVTGGYHSLKGYKAVILPMLTDLDEKDFERITEYVRGGGRVYISGAEAPELLSKLLSAEVKGRTESRNIYLSPTDEGKEHFLDFNKVYPLPFEGSAPILSFSGNYRVLATLTLPYTGDKDAEFVSIHSDPPGKETEHPAVVEAELGAGSVIWSAVPIEAEEIYEYRKIFFSLLSRLLPDYRPSFKAQAPEEAEITLFDSGEYLTLNVVTVDERPINRLINSFEVSVKTDHKPRSVKLLPEGEDIDFSYEDGYVTFKVRPFTCFDMYCIYK